MRLVSANADASRKGQHFVYIIDFFHGEFAIIEKVFGEFDGAVITDVMVL